MNLLEAYLNTPTWAVVLGWVLVGLAVVIALVRHAVPAIRRRRARGGAR